MTTSKLTAAIDANIQLLDEILSQAAADAQEAAQASVEGRTNEAIGWLASLEDALASATALRNATATLNRARSRGSERPSSLKSPDTAGT